MAVFLEIKKEILTRYFGLGKVLPMNRVYGLILDCAIGNENILNWH